MFKLLPILLFAVTAQAALTIDAGPTKTIAFPAKDLTLFGHASEPITALTSIQWTQTGGPVKGGIKFSAPQSLATTVSFTMSGTYTFNLTVSDGTTTAFSKTLVVVLPSTAQTAFYVDKNYTGGANDGTAAHPWTTLSLAAASPVWATINAALAKNHVIVYFAARQAVSDTSEVENGEVNLWRKDTGSNRLTLDGMSMYNASTVTTSPNWLPYAGSTMFQISEITGHFISIGVQSSNTAYPMNYTTIRGFDVTGSGGRMGVAGNSIVVEYVHTHGITSIGSTMTLQGAVTGACVKTFGNLQDITFRNNLIENGYGEGIYLAGTYHLANDGGCLTWGNTHKDILVEGNTISHPGMTGGQGDGVDMKAGLMNVTVRNNIIHDNSPASQLPCGITNEGIFMALGVPSNYLFEGNTIYSGANAGIKLTNQLGSIIRNNLIYSNAGEGISLTGSGLNLPNNSMVQIYNNTVVGNGGGISIGYADKASMKNNVVFSNAVGKQVTSFSSTNTSSDYNLYSVTGSAAVNEGIHTVTLPLTTNLFVSPSTSNYSLMSNSYKGMGVQ